MGANIPLPALSVHMQQPPDPLEQYSRIMQIRRFGQESQMQDMQLQQAKQQQTDSQALTKAVNEANGDPDKASQLALKYGASATGVAKYQDSIQQMRERATQNDKGTLEVLDKQHENLRGALQPLVDLAKKTPQAQPQANAQPSAQGSMAMLAQMAQGGGQSSGETINGIQPGAQPGAQPQQADPLAQKKQAIWTQQRNIVMQNPKAYGITDPSHVPPEQYPGDDWVMGTNASLATGHNLVTEAAAKMRGSPESQSYRDLIESGMSPEDALRKVKEIGADVKPDTAAQAKQNFQSAIGKVVQENGNTLPEGSLTNPRKLQFFIQQSKSLTPQEKQGALSYMAANPTPASQALNVVLRGQSYGTTRQYSVLDTQNGNRPIYVSADELNDDRASGRNRYVASGPGTQALNKENLMEDIRGGIQQVRSALNDKDMPEFTAGQRTKLAIAMRERDPRSAVSSLITSGALGQLDPKQEDYLIAHSILAEQAMAMRTVLGAGQGSQDLRAAITNTFPGPTTPSKAYGLKQLDAFEQTINRLERGIPNVPLKSMGNGNNAAPAPQGMINVQIPGHPPGQIPASSRQRFLQENPGAQVLP